MSSTWFYTCEMKFRNILGLYESKKEPCIIKFYGVLRWQSLCFGIPLNFSVCVCVSVSVPRINLRRATWCGDRRHSCCLILSQAHIHIATEMNTSVWRRWLMTRCIIAWAQKIFGNNRDRLGRLVRSQHTEPMWLAQSVTLGDCCTCLLPEMKTLSLPCTHGIMPQ